MKVVITGATGNVGTSVLRALAEEPVIEEIVGHARRQRLPDTAAGGPHERAVAGA